MVSLELVIYNLRHIQQLPCHKYARHSFWSELWHEQSLARRTKGRHDKISTTTQIHLNHRLAQIKFEYANRLTRHTHRHRQTHRYWDTQGHTQTHIHSGYFIWNFITQAWLLGQLTLTVGVLDLRDIRWSLMIQFFMTGVLGFRNLMFSWNWRHSFCSRCVWYLHTDTHAMTYSHTLAHMRTYMLWYFDVVQCI